MELASTISIEADREFWLGNNVFGKWKHPIPAKYLRYIGAPPNVKVEIVDKRDNSVDIVLTYDDKRLPVNTGIDMPRRGKDWRSVSNIDWDTGKSVLYPARDNYIAFYAKFDRFPESTEYTQAPPSKNDELPRDFHREISYKWQNNKLFLLDRKTNTEYFFVEPPRGKHMGTMGSRPYKPNPANN